jgi:hypothetical protein
MTNPSSCHMLLSLTSHTNALFVFPPTQTSACGQRCALRMGTPVANVPNRSPLALDHQRPSKIYASRWETGLFASLPAQTGRDGPDVGVRVLWKFCAFVQPALRQMLHCRTPSGSTTAAAVFLHCAITTCLCGHWCSRHARNAGRTALSIGSMCSNMRKKACKRQTIKP